VPGRWQKAPFGPSSNEGTLPLRHILGGDRTYPPIDAALPEGTDSPRGAQWCDVPTAEAGSPSLAGPLEMRLKSLGQPLLAASEQPKMALRPNERSAPRCAPALDRRRFGQLRRSFQR
jgi:hypothetical protein